MKQIKYDNFTYVQGGIDPLSIVLDGIVIDNCITPRTYEQFDRAWERLTPIQKQLYGKQLCVLFLGDKTGEPFYTHLMRPPIEKHKKTIFEKIQEFFRI